MQTGTRQSPARSARAVAPPAVLLVDDDTEVREVLRDVLLASGFRVTTARSGEAALAALQMRTFDAVVTDLWLPGAIDGWELRRRMLARPEWRRLPTVLTRVGADAGPPVAHLAPAATLNKPIDPDELAGTLRRVLGRPAEPRAEGRAAGARAVASDEEPRCPSC